MRLSKSYFDLELATFKIELGELKFNFLKLGSKQRMLSHFIKIMRLYIGGS